MRFIILLALAIHGPLLALQLPLTNSYDANFHVFFASHYAHHWFDPWNPKWFAGFSQTTYPPLTTVSARCADAGDVAVGLLLSQMNGGASGEIRHKLNSHLVVRASTGPAPAKRKSR